MILRHPVCRSTRAAAHAGEPAFPLKPLEIAPDRGGRRVQTSAQLLEGNEAARGKGLRNQRIALVCVHAAMMATQDSLVKLNQIEVLSSSRGEAEVMESRSALFCLGAKRQ
jgi:hypothetical protein